MCIKRWIQTTETDGEKKPTSVSALVFHRDVATGITPDCIVIIDICQTVQCTWYTREGQRKRQKVCSLY